MSRKFLTPIILPADPAAAMEAATKQYVDSKVVGGGTDEVWVGAAQPSDPNLELWYDTDEASPPVPTTEWNSAWGIVAMGVLTTTHAGFTGGSYFGVSNMNLNFNAVAGRRYKATATFQGNASTAATDWCAIRILKSGVTLGGSQQTLTGASGQESISTVMPPQEFAPGPVNLYVQAYFGTGSGSIVASPEFPCTFIIEDVGPTVRDSGVEATPIMQWNAAWGIFAMGTVATNPVTVAAAGKTALTQLLSFTPLVGRQYRAVFNMRALQPTTAANVSSTIELVDASNVLYPGTSDRWFQVLYGTGYAQMPMTWQFAGSGVASAVRVVTSGGSTSLYAYPTEFYIEDIGPVAGAVPIANPTPAWNLLPLTAPWTNYGGGWGLAAYRKVGDIVSLRGLVKSTGGFSSIGTLPPDCRPVATFMSLGWASWNGSGVRAAVRIDVTSTGTVDFASFGAPTGTAAPSNIDHLNLDLISFSVAP